MYRLPARSINTWKLLKKTFVQKYYSPSRFAKKMEEIRDFGQLKNETLYEAWDRFNDLLYMCPTHKLDNYWQVLIFYKGLSIHSRRMLDSQGPIPMMPPAQAILSIQMMADHLRNWYGEEMTLVTNSNSLNDIGELTKKIASLWCDMKEIKENIHAIQERSLREECIAF